MDQQDLDALVARLRRQGTDDGSVEVKSSASSLSKDVWESVSAFANTRGGLIVLGLSEADGFTPVPSFQLDRVLDQLVDGMGDGNPAGARLTDPPTYRVDRLTVDDALVLVIEVEENPLGQKPCYVTARGLVSGSFRRVDDKDIVLTAPEVFELQNILVSHDADRAPVTEATVEDLYPVAVERLLTRKAGSKALRGADDVPSKLRNLNVLDREGAPRLAGLLTLGRYPQRFFPRLLVDVLVHPGNEKSPPHDVRYLDRQECEGPLGEVVDDAVAAVARNLRTQSVVTGTGRVDELEIPATVLREAIANAVVHREYHPLFNGQAVTVDVFPDRVVITNPGGLWGGKTLETLDDGFSRCRNPTLMQLLQDVPLSTGETAAEGGGGGVRLMIHQMEAQSLARPSFRASADWVSVELRRHGAEIAANRAWLGEVSPRDLSRHEGQALLTARREGHVSVPVLRRELHLDSDDARQVLSSLERSALLQRIGDDDYALPAVGSMVGSTADDVVLRCLSTTTPLDVHAIAERTGRSVGALRPVLRRLVAGGNVLATAPPTSRYRRYLRAPGSELSNPSPGNCHSRTARTDRPT